MKGAIPQRKLAPIQPCLPRPAKEPSTGPDWLHEIKHDGFRILARKDAKGVRGADRNSTWRLQSLCKAPGWPKSGRRVEKGQKRGKWSTISWFHVCSKMEQRYCERASVTRPAGTSTTNWPTMTGAKSRSASSTRFARNIRRNTSRWSNRPIQF